MTILDKSTESKPPSMPLPPTTKTESDPNVDDFGYGVVVPPADDKPADDKPADDKVDPPADDKPAEKLSGYGKEEPADDKPADDKVDPPAEEKKPEDMSDEEKTQKEINDTIKSLGDGYDIAKISKFALDNKFSKEQVAAYVKNAKDEQAAFLKSEKERVLNQRKAWDKELRSDPDFGGDNFIKNVDRVDKLLQNNLIDTKKMLTEKGGVLPPYLMKDLARIAKLLNPTTKHVGGDPPAPKESDSSFLDEMYK